MIRKLVLLVLSTTVILSTTTQVFASGSYGGGSGSFGTSSRPAKQIDHNYEQGKAIYTGRKSSAGKLDYCLAVDGELKPVRRSSLKTYKRTTYDNVANNLYNCNEPEQLISEKLSNDELLYVLYYLNKRFRLYLG